MKKTLFSLFLLITITSLFAEAQTIKKIDPQNFEKKLTESKGPILVDVRTAGEYAQGHLANAVLIDIYSNDFKNRVAKLDKIKARVLFIVRPEVGVLPQWMYFRILGSRRFMI
ncbi:MAG: rhodanese-like domain-containing protein [Cytophagales bacterium]|nr:rhodanese-like domain-containing protein [Cytophagales bacterium]